jgi:hypothetical protein
MAAAYFAVGSDQRMVGISHLEVGVKKDHDINYVCNVVRNTAETW